LGGAAAATSWRNALKPHKKRRNEKKKRGRWPGLKTTFEEGLIKSEWAALRKRGRFPRIGAKATRASCVGHLDRGGNESCSLRKFLGVLTKRKN